MKARYEVALGAICMIGAVAGCASNSCLRALSSSKGGTNATADCLRFLEVAATPRTSTFTRTVSVTSGVHTLTKRTVNHDANLPSWVGGQDNGHHNLDVFDQHSELQARSSGEKIPAYASPCASAAAFSSACSCIGVSAVTVTPKADSITITRTATRSVALATARPSLGNHTILSNNTSARWHNSTSLKLHSGTFVHKTPGSHATTQHGPLTFNKNPAQQDTFITSTSSVGRFSNSSAIFVLPSRNGTRSNPTAHVSPWNSSAVATTLLTSSTKLHFLNSSSSLASPPRSSKAEVLAASTSPWRASTMAKVSSNRTTSAGFLNSSAAIPTSLGTVTAIHWINRTTIIRSLPYSRTSVSATRSLAYNGTGRWQNFSASTVTVLRLNTSIPTAAPNITTGRWLNVTRLPVNTTTARWANSTLRANSTTPLWRNTSAKATPTPSPTVDLTCGETGSPFALQVSQPGGMFDKWWVHVVGDGLLFTAQSGSASAFSVEGTGHLCAVGHLAEDGKPYLASSGLLDASSAVWMLDQNVIEHLSDDYGALNCTASGGTLSCAANLTSHWIGCGLQLDISQDGSANVPYEGYNCASLGLAVVPFGNGTLRAGNGTTRGLYRNGTSLAARSNGHGHALGGYVRGVTYLQTS